MNITVNQHQFFVDDRGKRIIRSRDGRCCAAASICEFSMQIQSGEQQYALTPEQFSKTPMPDGARYENSILQVQLRYAPRGSAIAKKLSVTAKQPLTLLYMQTEYSRFDEPLRGGGEGQPYSQPTTVSPPVRCRSRSHACWTAAACRSNRAHGRRCRRERHFCCMT